MNIMEVNMDKKIIGYLSPEEDAHLVNSLAGGVVAGYDVDITNSGFQIGVAGRDLNLRNGYGGFLVIGNQAHIENSRIGILLGKSTTTLNYSKVLFTGRQVFLLGAVAGLIFAFLNGLLRRLME